MLANVRALDLIYGNVAGKVGLVGVRRTGKGGRGDWTCVSDTTSKKFLKSFFPALC